MASREEILSEIAKAASIERSKIDLPDPPVVWPLEELSPEQTFEKFSAHLTAVAGRAVLCPNRDAAAEKIAAELAALGAKKFGVKPGCESLAEQVRTRSAEAPEMVLAPETASDADPKALERLDAAIVAAEYLLADTGSCVVESRSAFERLLCYLSPACFVVAKRSQLREHLPHAWPEISERMRSAAAGEFLIMTGPSRTADIEKILILGVHGPKTVVVFVIENE